MTDRMKAWKITIAKTRRNISRILHNISLIKHEMAEQNCMGYAFGIHDWLELDNFHHAYNKEEQSQVFEDCIQELVDNYPCREIHDPGSARPNERVIAFRIGPTDFHFARLEKNKWKHKPGSTPIGTMSNSTFYSDKWVNLSGTVYNSPIVYFALQK